MFRLVVPSYANAGHPDADSSTRVTMSRSSIWSNPCALVLERMPQRLVLPQDLGQFEDLSIYHSANTRSLLKGVLPTELILVDVTVQKSDQTTSPYHFKEKVIATNKPTLRHRTIVAAPEQFSKPLLVDCCYNTSNATTRLATLFQTQSATASHSKLCTVDEFYYFS
ncbi:hypothetical protein FVER53590_26545 [Fusarium verticillioides]|nr:hypothetical protein FVER53590_26545 [Fusarium verticillioides]